MDCGGSGRCNAIAELPIGLLAEEVSRQGRVHFFRVRIELVSVV